MRTQMLILVGFLTAIFGSFDANAACGVFEVSKGDIKVQSAQTKQITAAGVGAKICSGDTVISGKDSRAKLKMEDGNELNISPDSKIALENYQFDPAQNKKKVLLNILQGKVRAATKQENMYNDKSRDGADNSFQVKTKSAVAGVRGTDFLTGFDPKTNKSEVVTFKGKVEFGQPGPGGSIQNAVQVGAGQKTEATPGQPPAPPKSIPPRELQQMNSETKADTGGSQSSGSTDKKSDKSDKKDGGGDKAGDKKDGGSDKQADKKDGAPEKKDGGGDKSASSGNGDKGGGDKSASGGGDKASGGSGDKQAGTGGGDKAGSPGGEKGGPAGGDSKQAGSNGGSGNSGGGSAGGPGAGSAGGDSGSKGSPSASTGAPAAGGASGPAMSSPGGEGSRGPASVSGPSGGSMINAVEIGGGTGFAGAPPVSSPTTPGTSLPVLQPLPTTAVPNTICDACRAAQDAKNTTSKLNITIKLPAK